MVKNVYDSNYDKMKKVISLITLALLQIGCFAVNVETTTNLNVYYPDYMKIDLVCGLMPKAEQKDVEFCCEAAFTGELTESGDG